ncbi:Cytochrome P450 monooxygenase, partial [Rasamsonia emersonii CBS 393.64]
MFLVAPYATLLLVFLFLYFFVYPFVEYIRDRHGLRKYPNMSLFSGMSNIPFMILAFGGFRSKYLAELHKKHPVIRTGPKTLSYGDARAIKDIYGHNTKCSKDRSYIVTSGTHFHLADVVDKPEHARKRKVLSSAYALKNLETWEYKVTDKVQRLFAHFDKVCTAPLPAGQSTPDPADLTLDFRAWTNFFTLDAIADIGLSERLGFLDKGNDICLAQRKDGTTYEVHLREALYPTARKQSLLLWNYEWYPVINKLANIIPFFGRMQRSANHGEKLDDFFAALMEDKDGRPNNLEWGEIVAEVNIML